MKIPQSRAESGGEESKGEGDHGQKKEEDGKRWRYIYIERERGREGEMSKKQIQPE